MNKTVTWSSKGYWTLNIHWELDCDPQMKVIWYSYILQVDGKDNTTEKKESWKLKAPKGKGFSMFTQLMLCFAQVVSMKQMIGRPETKMNISLICIILILFIEHMNITKISYTIHSNFWDFRNTNDIIYWAFHCDAKLESLILKFWNANPRWFGNITMNIYEFNSAVNHMRLDHC